MTWLEDGITWGGYAMDFLLHELRRHDAALLSFLILFTLQLSLPWFC